MQGLAQVCAEMSPSAAPGLSALPENSPQCSGDPQEIPQCPGNLLLPSQSRASAWLSFQSAYQCYGGSDPRDLGFLEGTSLAHLPQLCNDLIPKGKSPNFGARLPGFKPLLHHLLASVEISGNCLVTLSLSFHICPTGMRAVLIEVTRRKKRGTCKETSPGPCSGKC